MGWPGGKPSATMGQADTKAFAVLESVVEPWFTPRPMRPFSCGRNDQHPGVRAALLGNAGHRVKAMQTGSPETTVIAQTERIGEPVVTYSEGGGEFR